MRKNIDIPWLEWFSFVLLNPSEIPIRTLKWFSKNPTNIAWMNIGGFLEFDGNCSADVTELDLASHWDFLNDIFFIFFLLLVVLFKIFTNNVIQSTSVVLKFIRLWGAACAFTSSQFSYFLYIGACKSRRICKAKSASNSVSLRCPMYDKCLLSTRCLRDLSSWK